MPAVALLRTVSVPSEGREYKALMFACPGCAESGGDGVHMLPVAGDAQPGWDWDGSLEAPTLSPSILTTSHDGQCHSFLRAGVFEFLTDSTHSLAGQHVPMPPLPDYVLHEEI